MSKPEIEIGAGPDRSIFSLSGPDLDTHEERGEKNEKEEDEEEMSVLPLAAVAPVSVRVRHLSASVAPRQPLRLLSFRRKKKHDNDNNNNNDNNKDNHNNNSDNNNKSSPGPSSAEHTPPLPPLSPPLTSLDPTPASDDKHANVDVHARAKLILDDVSLTLPAGSLTAIVGASGSGKTSLLSLLAGRSPPAIRTSGSVEYYRQPGVGIGLHGSAGAGTGAEIGTNTGTGTGADTGTGPDTGTSTGTSTDTCSSAYIPQSDVLQPTLTVRETLRYAADLRLANVPAMRANAVARVIRELGLAECADTRLGGRVAGLGSGGFGRGGGGGGCSGGERRRVSIGIQMLADPSVLICDEPTTGLDAMSALQVVGTLRALAHAGRTVVLSIHAPRSEIWAALDRVVLLARGGRVLFAGERAEALPHFARLGWPAPAYVNPADFLVDVAAVDVRSEGAEKESAARVRRLREAWLAVEDERGDRDERSGKTVEKMPEVDLFLKTDSSARLTKETALSGGEPPSRLTLGSAPPSGFRRQVAVLTRRTFVTTMRDPLGMAAVLIEATVMAIVCGWIYLHLATDLTGIRSREGSLYTTSSLNGYLILLYETFRLTLDVRLFDRERADGVVGAAAWIISRRASRFLLEDIPSPVIFGTIFYWMAGYRADAAQFFIFLALSVLIHYTAVAFASVCIGAARTFATASFIANLSFTLQTMACGFFIQADQIPVYVRWLKWLAYTFYAFGALAANEFIGVGTDPRIGHFYDCPYSRNPADPRCRQYTGVFIMESLGLPHNWIWRPIVVLVAFVLGFHLLGILLLHFHRPDVVVARGNAGDEAPRSQLQLPPDEGRRRVTDERQITVSLDGLTLQVRSHALTRTGLTTRVHHILSPVHATFPPGRLNVIMGPSGSGKTTLLTALAGRFIGSHSRRVGGQMRYNGAVPSPLVIAAVSSLVGQDDDALMPSLTVRETLRYAAALRLPPHVSAAAKAARAEEVLAALGLKDCADTRIGSEAEGVRGVSGGEKRRVSVAIQILTDPRVLLVDEPTSGLDAFTAAGIIDVLAALAAEGRTVIATIHQSRSDLWPRFDRVLLLARGGAVVYAGDGAGMVPYFAACAHPCPPDANPADFALDLITVDLQHPAREAATRARVDKLISSWAGVEQLRRAEAGCGLGSCPAPAGALMEPAHLGSLKKEPNPFSTVFPVLLRRSSLNFFRQWPLIQARVGQGLGMVAIVMLFFSPLKNDYAGVQSRVGAVQQFASFYFVGLLQNLAVYPPERDVFYREIADGCTSTEAFILQYSALELPFNVVTAVISGVCMAYAVNMDRSGRMAGIAAFNAFGITSCGESLGLMVASALSHPGLAVNVASVLLAIANILAGTMSLQIPGFISALNRLSPCRYAVFNLAPYSLSRQQFHCSRELRMPDGRCPIENGEQVLQLYHLDHVGWLNLVGLAVCVVAYRIVAYVVVKLRVWFVR